MLILSVDVGIVNIGIVCFDTTEKKIVLADKFSLAPRLKALKSEDELVPRVYKLFLDASSKLSKYFKLSDLVLIEQQMKRKMLLIQNILATFCFSMNKDYLFVNPRCVKKYFDIGSFKRKKMGKPVKGAKNNHRANKLMAIKKVNEMLPGFLQRFKTSKHDDISDALLQVLWYTKVKI
jgi:hypothetical protein